MEIPSCIANCSPKRRSQGSFLISISFSLFASYLSLPVYHPFASLVSVALASPSPFPTMPRPSTYESHLFPTFCRQRQPRKERWEGARAPVPAPSTFLRPYSGSHERREEISICDIRAHLPAWSGTEVLEGTPSTPRAADDGVRNNFEKSVALTLVLIHSILVLAWPCARPCARLPCANRGWWGGDDEA